MDINTIQSTIEEKAAALPSIDATIKLQLDDKVIFIDGNGDQNTVSNDDKDADCTIITTSANLVKLANGELNAMTAMMTGKVKVKGNMALAMKLKDLA